MNFQERFAMVQNAKLLVVGAGGIGCELLKNLAPWRNRFWADFENQQLKDLPAKMLKLGLCSWFPNGLVLLDRQILSS